MQALFFPSWDWDPDPESLISAVEASFRSVWKHMPWKFVPLNSRRCSEIRASETYYSISDSKRIGTKKCAFRRTIAMQVNILLKSGDFEGAKALAPSEFFFVWMRLILSAALLSKRERRHCTMLKLIKKYKTNKYSHNVEGRFVCRTLWHNSGPNELPEVSVLWQCVLLLCDYTIKLCNLGLCTIGRPEGGVFSLFW